MSASLRAVSSPDLSRSFFVLAIPSLLKDYPCRKTGSETVGYTLSWVAVRSVGPEQALAVLGMEVADVLKYEDIGWGDNVVLGHLPGDWLLAVSGDSSDAFEGQLEPLTKLGQAVAGQISEIVMVSELRGYADGNEIWRVVHDPQEEESLYALQISGNAPPQLDTIVHSARAEQDKEGGEDAAVDFMIEIPGRLSHSICGYHPGEHEPFGVDFSELRPIGGKQQKPATGGFFARLFGRN
jgi:hypothetical protein